jgi:putative peptidoglycan lipid II flippase
MNPTAHPPKTRQVSIGNIAALLVAASIVGQVLGFLRTKLVNANFSATGPHSTDAYFAAFSIPDFFFFTLAAGALGVAFMPVLAEHLEKNDRKGVWELSASLLNFLALIMVGVGFVMLIFAQPLIHYVVAPRLQGEELKNAVLIMRLLAFNPLLFTITGVLTSVQQTMGRFFFYAIAPLFYNASIIISILIFSDAPGHHGGPWHLGIAGLGLGAMIGAIAQLLIVLFGSSKLNFHWHPKINWNSPDFHLILRNLPPRSLDQGIDQVNSVVETHIASSLGAGNISYYNNAFTLSTAPILLVGTAISTAAFPRLNQRLAQGRTDLFRRDFLMILRAMIWLAAPLVLVCFYCRGYLSRLIFAQDNAEIALIFGYLTLAIFFRIIYTIISRWFYAQRDTKTPLFVSFFTIGLNIILAVTLTRPGAYGIAGLALAQSIVAMVEVIILVIIMLFRDHRLFDAAFWDGLLRIVSVSGFSAVAGFIMVKVFPLGLADKGIFTLGSKLVIISAVTFGVHVGVSALFGLDEVGPVFRRIRKIALKPLRIN